MKLTIHTDDFQVPESGRKVYTYRALEAEFGIPEKHFHAMLHEKLSFGIVLDFDMILEFSDGLKTVYLIIK